MFTPKLELVLTTLMALTGLIYCIVHLESLQAGKEVGATLETIFFTTTAVSYFVITAWMCRIKNRFNGGLPYTISIAGSAAINCNICII